MAFWARPSSRAMAATERPAQPWASRRRSAAARISSCFSSRLRSGRLRGILTASQHDEVGSWDYPKRVPARKEVAAMTGINLDGARILLTGASSGIGRATAKRLAARGAHLAVAARRRELLDTLAEEIEVAGHQRPVVLAPDLPHPPPPHLL